MSHHFDAVPFRRDGACALVQNRTDLAEAVARQHAGQEIVFVSVIDEVAVGQVPRLVPVGQVVDDENILLAGRIQVSDDIAADKSGAAGNDDHIAVYLLVCASDQAVIETHVAARHAHG